MTWLTVINPKLQQVKLSGEVYYGEEAGITFRPQTKPDIQGNNGKPHRQFKVQDGRQQDAQSYLDERQGLQPKRPSLPIEDLWQFCWDYHQGRLLTWNIAGNHPDLPPGVQLGIADRRALTTPTTEARRQTRPSAKTGS